MKYIRMVFKFCVSILIGALGFAFVSHLLEGPPIHLLSLTERDGIAVRGGRLELLVHRTQSRLCENHTDRELWRWQARGGKRLRVIVPLPFRSAVIVPQDETEFVVSLDVPGNIEPGLWFYTARSTYSCSWFPPLFSQRVVQTPDVPINVQDPTSSSQPNVINTPTPLTIVPQASP